MQKVKETHYIFKSKKYMKNTNKIKLNESKQKK